MGSEYISRLEGICRPWSRVLKLCKLGGSVDDNSKWKLTASVSNWRLNDLSQRLPVKDFTTLCWLDKAHLCLFSPTESSQSFLLQRRCWAQRRAKNNL